jgi:hypothetical protein
LAVFRDGRYAVRVFLLAAHDLDRADVLLVPRPVSALSRPNGFTLHWYDAYFKDADWIGANPVQA